MQIITQATAYVTEDGATFFSEVEAKAHEALLYIGKTIEAFGHEQVMFAVNAVQRVDEKFVGSIMQVYDQLRGIHATLPVNEYTPVIASINAPDAIRSSETQPVVAAAVPLEQTGTGLPATEADLKTDETQMTAAPPRLADRWKSEHPDQEQVQRPDQTRETPSEPLPGEQDGEAGHSEQG